MSHHTCPVVLPEEQRFAVYALDCPYCILMLTLDIISPDFLVDVYWRPNVEWWARCKGHIFPFPPAQTRSKGTMTWKSSHVMVVSSANTEDSPLTCHFHSFGSLWAVSEPPWPPKMIEIRLGRFLESIQIPPLSQIMQGECTWILFSVHPCSYAA